MFLILLFCSNLYGQLSTKFYSKYGGDGRDLGYGGKETFIKKQYIVIGSTSSFGNGSSDAYLFLIDSVGQILWQKSFGGSNADIGKSVIINPIDSGYIFTPNPLSGSLNPLYSIYGDVDYPFTIKPYDIILLYLK